MVGCSQRTTDLSSVIAELCGSVSCPTAGSTSAKGRCCQLCAHWALCHVVAGLSSGSGSVGRPDTCEREFRASSPRRDDGPLRATLVPAAAAIYQAGTCPYSTPIIPKTRTKVGVSNLLLLCVTNLAFLLGLSESQMPNLAASAPAVARCAVPAGAIMVPAPARCAAGPGPRPLLTRRCPQARSGWQCLALRLPGSCVGPEGRRAAATTCCRLPIKRGPVGTRRVGRIGHFPAMGLGAVDSEGIGLRAQVGACPGRHEPPGATPRGASGSLTRNVGLSGV